MRFLLISGSGSIKEYQRMPSLISPKDILIDLGTNELVNHVLSLRGNKVDEDQTSIPEREQALVIAEKLSIIKRVA